MDKPILINEFLRRKRVPVKIMPDQVYSLVTVKLHHKGVVLRETKKGALLGSSMYRVSAGDFILSGIDARNGAFGIVPLELDGAIVTNDFWYFDIDESKVKRDFFYWLTTTPLFLDICQRSSKGETQRIRLQRDLFLNSEFHFPPVEHQEEFLSLFQKIEKPHEALQGEFATQSALLTQLRQAILQEAIEGKLTADWRKTHPIQKGDPETDAEALLAKIKTEKQKLIANGKLKKEKPFPPISPDDTTFNLPPSWVWTRLGEICLINPRNHLDDTLDVAFSTMPMVSEKFGVSPRFDVRKWGEIKKGFTHFADKDVAIAKITPCFENSKSCVFVGLKNGYGAGTTELHVLRRICANPHYIYLNIKNEKFIQAGKKLMSGAVGQKRIPVTYVSQATTPLPPLAEQRAIVERVDKLISLVDELEIQVTVRKSHADALLQTVLRDAFGRA